MLAAARSPINWKMYFVRSNPPLICLAWIESAKREETRLRLTEAIRLLASGKVLGLK